MRRVARFVQSRFFCRYEIFMANGMCVGRLKCTEIFLLYLIYFMISAVTVHGRVRFVDRDIDGEAGTMF